MEFGFQNASFDLPYRQGPPKLVRENSLYDTLKIVFLIWHWLIFSSLCDLFSKFLSLYDTLVHVGHQKRHKKTILPLMQNLFNILYVPHNMPSCIARWWGFSFCSQRCMCGLVPPWQSPRSFIFVHFKISVTCMLQIGNKVEMICIIVFLFLIDG